MTIILPDEYIENLYDALGDAYRTDTCYVTILSGGEPNPSGVRRKGHCDLLTSKGLMVDTGESYRNRDRGEERVAYGITPAGREVYSKPLAEALAAIRAAVEA